MTDFAACLAVDDRGAAVPLYPVTSAGLDTWRAGLNNSQRALAQAQRFAARPDELLLLPVDGGFMAVAGVADAPGPWALASAAARLPAGRYRLHGDLGAAGLGWCLAQHRFGRYRSVVEAGSAGDTGARLLLTDAPAAITEAVRLADAMALARDLIDTPASDLGPAELADAILADARRFGATASVTSGEALLDAGFPAVHAVGRAASRAPRLIDMVWGDPAHPRVTLVGKGVVFDSGGLDIKPSAGMALMKKDMGGAATMMALARLVMAAGLPLRLRLIVPAVENAISGNAMRPGDVLATRAGLNIEVTNTDAEGRLVLADALALAAEERPDLIIDAATLTGAARTALGPQLPALFSNDARLAAALLAAGTAADDPLWQLPLWPGYRDMLKSSIADLVNAAEGGMAGAITAALFLERFVPAGIAWAHIDSFAWNPLARPGRPKGGEALALRACWQMLQSRQYPGSSSQ